MNQNNIGEFIAKVRKERGLTQDDIARKLGITSQSVSKWERGVNVPDISILKDLSGMLGVTVEELLRGKRENCHDVSDVKENNIIENKITKKKKYLIYGLIVFLVVVICIGVVFQKFNHNQESENSNYTNEFIQLEKDDEMIPEALSYVNFMLHLNEKLVEKIFDKNEDKITKEDFNIDEKMYLALSKFSKDNGGYIYYCVDCYFKPEELDNLVFEDTSFINNYKENGKHYLIQDSIDLIYERGLYSAIGDPGGELDEPRYVFDILDVKRNKDKLVLEFKLGYLRYELDESSVDPKCFVYKTIGDQVGVELAEDHLKWNDTHKIYNGILSDKYNKYRYTLKIVDDKLYFESMERM